MEHADTLDATIRKLERAVLQAEGAAVVRSIFKIRRPSDGLFSEGTTEANFGPVGNEWRSRGALTAYLHSLDEFVSGRWYESCEIVELKVIEVPVDRSSTQEWLERTRPAAARRREARNARREASARAQQARRQAEIDADAARRSP